MVFIVHFWFFFFFQIVSVDSNFPIVADSSKDNEEKRPFGLTKVSDHREVTETGLKTKKTQKWNKGK